MADSDYRTVLMHLGDFILLPPDENGIVRHQTTDGLQAFGQRLARRLLAIRGESTFDETIGLPLFNLADLGTPAVFASFAAETLRNDDEVQNIHNVDFLPQSEEDRQNGNVVVTIRVTRVGGENTNIETSIEV